MSPDLTHGSKSELGSEIALHGALDTFTRLEPIARLDDVQKMTNGQAPFLLLRVKTKQSPEVEPYGLCFVRDVLRKIHAFELGAEALLDIGEKLVRIVSRDRKIVDNGRGIGNLAFCTRNSSYLQRKKVPRLGSK